MPTPGSPCGEAMSATHVSSSSTTSMKYSETSPSPDGLTALRSDSSSLWPKVSPTGTATVTWCVVTAASSVGGASG